MERGGQVYFVHNRVHNIELIATRAARLVPEARILIGHGQMHEDQLEQVMLDFADGEARRPRLHDDHRVRPRHPERQHDHHQPRRQASASRSSTSSAAASAAAPPAPTPTSCTTSDRALTEIAQKRLQAIFEATELGAGFQIALRDLEIRGAGNLLGAEQSGHIAAVGFDLYAKLLAEAVTALKRAVAPEAPEGPATLPPIAARSTCR